MRRSGRLHLPQSSSIFLLSRSANLSLGRNGAKPLLKDDRVRLNAYSRADEHEFVDVAARDTQANGSLSSSGMVNSAFGLDDDDPVGSCVRFWLVPLIGDLGQCISVTLN